MWVWQDVITNREGQMAHCLSVCYPWSRPNSGMADRACGFSYVTCIISLGREKKEYKNLEDKAR